jgi:purine-nucleoside phosphorylase
VVRQIIDGTDPAAASLLQAAAHSIRARAPRAPAIGVVLGSGLGDWAERLEARTAIAYADIPHMPRTGVAGHAGALCLGQTRGVEVACLSGRVHTYEGHSLERVVFGVRLLAALGCRAVLLTNAAGGIRDELTSGGFMSITDHINLTGNNPLIGWATKGSPFIDMTAAYDLRLRSAAAEAARAAGVTLSEGVYAGVLGPSYETPAEIRMLRALGADAVGMSTVSEVIALREQGVPVGAISCITNAAAGLRPGELNHEDVQRAAARAKAQFQTLLDGWVERAARLIS